MRTAGFELYDSTVAYDAAHSAMMALDLNKFDGRSALSTCFYRIAQNESFSELGRLIKKRERETSIHVPVRGGQPGETEIMEIEASPPDRTAALDLSKRRRELPPEQEEVFHLNEEEGRTVDEIAEMKGLPRGTVASRLRAAKRKLGIPLRRRGPARRSRRK